MTAEEVYLQGFVDGITCFAWMKDGTRYVGTCGTKLKDAVKNAKTLWNYSPPKGGEADGWTER